MTLLLLQPFKWMWLSPPTLVPPAPSPTPWAGRWGRCCHCQTILLPFPRKGPSFEFPVPRASFLDSIPSRPIHDVPLALLSPSCISFPLFTGSFLLVHKTLLISILEKNPQTSLPQLLSPTLPRFSSWKHSGELSILGGSHISSPSPWSQLQADLSAPRVEMALLWTTVPRPPPRPPYTDTDPMASSLSSPSLTCRWHSPQLITPPWPQTPLGPRHHTPSFPVSVASSLPSLLLFLIPQALSAVVLGCWTFSVCTPSASILVY